MTRIRLGLSHATGVGVGPSTTVLPRPYERMCYPSPNSPLSHGVGLSLSGDGSRPSGPPSPSFQPSPESFSLFEPNYPQTGHGSGEPQKTAPDTTLTDGSCSGPSSQPERSRLLVLGPGTVTLVGRPERDRKQSRVLRGIVMRSRKAKGGRSNASRNRHP